MTLDYTLQCLPLIVFFFLFFLAFFPFFSSVLFFFLFPFWRHPKRRPGRPPIAPCTQWSSGWKTAIVVSRMCLQRDCLNLTPNDLLSYSSFTFSISLAIYTLYLSYSSTGFSNKIFPSVPWPMFLVSRRHCPASSTASSFSLRFYDGSMQIVWTQSLLRRNFLLRCSRRRLMSRVLRLHLTFPVWQKSFRLLFVCLNGFTIRQHCKVL